MYTKIIYIIMRFIRKISLLIFVHKKFNNKFGSEQFIRMKLEGVWYIQKVGDRVKIISCFYSN